MSSHIHEPVLQILAGSAVESRIVFAFLSGKYTGKMGKDGVWGSPEACQAGDLVELYSRQAGWRVRVHTQDISLSLQSAASVFCLVALTAFLLPLWELPSYYHNYNLYTFH